MSVNGVTNVMADAYATSKPTAKKTETKQAPQTAEDLGVVYEPSTNATDSKTNKMTDYSSIVSSMKQELAARNQHLQNLVNQLLGQQAKKYTTLADLFRNMEADPATIEQAKEDISEDGYWGVEQTSDRLVSMAQALSGGDTSKADEMIAAIKKGFEQATGDWGEELPEICKKTIDTAVDKLEKWRDGVTGDDAVQE